MRLPRPTFLGAKALIFYALLVTAYLCTPYANLLFFLLAFLTVLGASTVYWSVRNVAGLRVTLHSPAPVPLGRAASLTGTMAGGSRARFALELGFELPTGKTTTLASAQGRGETPFHVELPLLPRGVHPLHRVRIQSRWPLGLWNLGHRLDKEALDVVVYPAPISQEAEQDERRGGATQAQGGSDSVQPAGLREFRPGDEPRQVHWRATARRSHLVITEWDEGRGSRDELVLDRRTDPAALEHALAIVSTFATRAREQKEELTLHTQGLSATFGGEQRPWDELWRFLAEAGTVPADGAAPPPAPPQAQRIGALVGAAS